MKILIEWISLDSSCGGGASIIFRVALRSQLQSDTGYKQLSVSGNHGRCNCKALLDFHFLDR
jgi:hypothetical protein